jgi:probable F420-dependent oxidoreductase
MRFGWDIPNVHHGFGLDAYSFGDRYEESVAVNVTTFNEVSARAEQIGFDAVWIADHVVFPDSSSSGHPLRYRANSGRDDDDDVVDRHNVRSQDPSFEAITTMSYLAGRTTRCRIGVGVLVIPYRNPLLAAKMLATLDVLSGGRIIVAAGVGWLKEAFVALGADYVHRGAVTDEYIDLMRTVWREDDPEFHGRFYEIPAGLRVYPKPLQKPAIPVWVGGVSKPALRRAATRGDGWLGVYQPVEATRAIHAQLGEQLAQAGRGAEEFTFAHRVRFQVTDQPGGDQPCIGRPRAVADGIRRYHDAGVQHLQLAPPPGPTTAYLLEQADRFEADVLPLISDLWSG